MKKLKFLLACMLLTACVQTIETDFPSVNSKGEYAIQFGSKLTRASLNTVSGTDYDEFNLYVWNFNNDTIMKPYKVQGSGAGQYDYASLPNQELKYFSNSANNYYFTGVIPTTHKETVIADTIKVDTIKAFTVDDNRVSGTLTAESPEEFLWAYKKVNKSDYANIVNFPFKHQNALIYLGFSSDRNDTQLLNYAPGSVTSTPNPQTSVLTGNAWARTSTALASIITDEDIAYINGKLNTSQITFTFGSDASVPTQGLITGYFDENIKSYLETEHPQLVGSTELFMAQFTNFYCIHIERSGSEICGWFYNKKKSGGSSVTPYPATFTNIVSNPIEGIRVFSADSVGENNLPADTLYCVHIPHTMIADAYIDSTGCKLDNRVTSDSVIQFSLPTTTTLSATPVWSATTFYGLPGDANFNFIVVKLSYIYNGVTSYDVRVPIKLPAGGLQAGKYYKYEIKIQSTGNGTNDPDEAKDEKDEILIEGLHPIVVDLQVDDYNQGANQQIKI